MPVQATSYADSSARTSDMIYMVRAVSLETLGTGTYFAASQSVMAPLSLSGVSSARPVATPASFQPTEDTPLPVPLGGTDADGDPLEVLIVRPPTNGKLVGVGANLAYHPYPNYTGPDTFEFVVNDGFQDSAPATVTLQVQPENDAAGSTTAADSNPSTTKFNATLQGSASILATGGISGGALQIPSTGSRARITGQIYSGFVSAGSTSVWFRAQDVANNSRNQIIATMGSTNGRHWNAHLRNGELRVHFRSSTLTTLNNDTLVVPGIQNNTWYHLVVSYQLETTRACHGVQVFLNGQSVGWLARERFYRLEQTHGFGNAVGPTAFPGAAVTGSTTTPPDAWFNGQIDEARHYSTPLRGPEVVALYHLGQPPTPNQPPVANIQATPEPDGEPLRIAWSGVASSDPDGTIYSYHWLFSDGTTATGPEVVQNYSETGSHGATLTVMDNEGAQASKSLQVSLGSTTAPRGTPLSWLNTMFGSHPDPAAVELLDHDGDQQPAWIEYLAGTDPADPDDNFQITHIQENANGSRTLRWRGSNTHGADATFRVFSSQDLTPGSWSPISGALEPSTSPEMEWTTPVHSGNRFYRIQID